MAYRHQEHITFHPVLQISYLAMLAVFLWATLQGPRDAADFVVLPLIGLLLLSLPLLFGRLVVAVDEQTLVASWGYFCWPQVSLPLSEIERSEITRYRPIRQFGGWGIRCGRIEGDKVSCYTLQGNQGLLLTLKQERRISLARTRKFLIGTPHPELLQQALGV